ncbi:MAG: c-type cytochrome domain-containing protein [Pirellula sp.]
MTYSTAFSTIVMLVIVGTCCAAADEVKKITYDDHIKPIFREHCTSCHNANDKKSGLALDTYQALMNGGSGGEIVVAGDLDSSRLYALTARKEQPYMPPNQDMIPQAKIDLLKTWIEQGMPENSGSAIKKATPSSAALGVVSLGRPEGAPPMPVSMPKQTPFYTSRAATISALAASPWAPLVAVGGQMQVSLYNSDTGELQGIIPFPEGEPQSITFSRDGKLILIGGGRHSVGGYAALHEIATGKRIARVGDELDVVFSADISDDNQLIALAGPQKMVRVFETLTGQLKYEQKKHTDWIYCVRFSPDGLLLATSDRSSGLVVWESHSGRLYMDLPGHKGEIRSLAWRPDSQALISGSFDGTLKIWDMNEGKQIKSWDAHPGGVAAVAVSNDGTMVSTGKDMKVKVWDGAGNAAGEMPVLAEVGYEVAITVDSKQIVAGDWLGNVRLWQRADPKNEKQLAANPMPLEQALAAVQEKLEKAIAQATQAQADFEAKQSQLTATQNQINEQQSLVVSLTFQLQSMAESNKSLPTQVESLSTQLANIKTEVTALKAKSVEKQSLIVAITKSKAQLTEAIESMRGLRGAASADVATIDAQIQAQSSLADLQAKTLVQLQSESIALESDLVAKDKAIIDLTATLDTKSKELAANASKSQELNAAKSIADKNLQSATATLKPASDAFASALKSLDASNQLVTDLMKQTETLQSDIARFVAWPKELITQRTVAEQNIVASQAQLKPFEEKIATVKSQLDTANGEMTKLEQQLAALQALIASEQAKRSQIQTQLAEQQKAIEAVQLQIQQNESELGSLMLQQQLFEQAYGKKSP